MSALGWVRWEEMVYISMQYWTPKIVSKFQYLELSA